MRRGVGDSSDSFVFVQRRWIDTAIRTWLTSSEVNRVLFVSGPTGTGKSRLLHQWERTLESPGLPPATVAAAIVRDPHASRVDLHSWLSIRNALLSLVPKEQAAALARDRVNISVSQVIESVAGQNSVVGFGANALNINLNDDYVKDFSDVVSPLADFIPVGDPIVILVDGIDEATHDHADAFVAALAVLGGAIRHAPFRDRGLGRLRLILAGQPEMPPAIRALNPEMLDLRNPPKGDEEDLRRYADLLLEELDEPDRERLAPQVARRAAGIWVWAYSVATAIVEDVRSGGAAPAEVTIAPGLENVYADALIRVQRRAAAKTFPWQRVLELIGAIAAAQDIGAALPREIAAMAVDVSRSELAVMMSEMKSIVTVDGRDQLRFFHGDFGRWVIADRVEGIDVGESHDLLAGLLADLGKAGWSHAGVYVAERVLPYAIAAAERGVGGVSYGRRVQRCIELLADVGRLAVDPLPWIVRLRNVAEICGSNAVLPGTTVRISGLYRRIYLLLEFDVGTAIARPLTTAQIDEFEHIHKTQGKSAASLWMEVNTPSYRQVVLETSRNQAIELLSGWEPTGWEPESRQMLSEELIADSYAITDPRLLESAVRSAEQAVESTPVEDERYSSRLRSLSNSLWFRVGTAGEQPGDLDRLIELQQRLVERPDLDPAGLASASKVLADASLDRAHRGGEGAEADIERALAAARHCVELTSSDDERYTGRLMSLANALMLRLRGAEEEQPDELDRLIEIQQQIVDRHDLTPASSAAANELLADCLIERTRRTEETTDDPDRALSAAQLAVDLTDSDDARYTGRLMSVADSLAARVGGAGEQPGDLDRLIETQQQVVDRPDLDAAGLASAKRLLADCVDERARRGGDTVLADRARAVSLTPIDDERYLDRLRGWANSLWSLVQDDDEQPGELDRLVEVHQRIVDHPDLDPAGAASANRLLADSLNERVVRGGGGAEADLERALAAVQRSIELSSVDDEEYPDRLMTLANCLWLRVRVGEQPGDLDRSIEVQQQVVDSPHLDPAVRANTCKVLADWLMDRARRGGEGAEADLERALATAQRSIELSSVDDEEYPDRLMTLANCLWLRVRVGEQPGDLDRSIEVQQQVVDSPHLDPAVRANTCKVLAEWLMDRARRGGEGAEADLERALVAAQQSVELTSADHERCTARLMTLANCLALRMRGEDELPEELDRFIEIQQRVVDRPDLTQASSAAANEMLADWLVERARRTGAVTDDLDRALAAARLSVQLTAPDDERYAGRLMSVADSLWWRVRRMEDPAELDQLIDVQQQIADRPDLSPARAASANELLAHCLLDRVPRHAGYGALVDLERALLAAERCVALAPVDDEHYTGGLTSMANILSLRLRRGEQPGDLERLIEVHEQIADRPDLDPARLAAAHALLAESLTQRALRGGDGVRADLERAVSLAEKALEMTSVDDGDHVDRLVVLANTLWRGYVEGIAGCDPERMQDVVTKIGPSPKNGRSKLADPLTKLVREYRIEWES
ncbi:DUF5663 domain-containing protein [Nocardia lijiangensis]|uniref:DUF5663 domain-containing protein n=1 Tax=Nocardia lijiangensis TaxID=299618 RepID=UPI003D72B66E